MALQIQGSCHCGNLSLTLTMSGDPAGLTPRACTCSFCLARRARWISVPDGEVELAAADAANVSRYRFATATADFIICTRCGTHLAAACEVDGSLYAVLNLDTIEALREALADATAVSFDGEDAADRLARRKRSWTPARWAA